MNNWPPTVVVRESGAFEFAGASLSCFFRETSVMHPLRGVHTSTPAASPIAPKH